MRVYIILIHHYDLLEAKTLIKGYLRKKYKNRKFPKELIHIITIFYDSRLIWKIHKKDIKKLIKTTRDIECEKYKYDGKYRFSLRISVYQHLNGFTYLQFYLIPRSIPNKISCTTIYFRLLFKELNYLWKGIKILKKNDKKSILLTHKLCFPINNNNKNKIKYLEQYTFILYTEILKQFKSYQNVFYYPNYFRFKINYKIKYKWTIKKNMISNINGKTLISDNFGISYNWFLEINIIDGYGYEHDMLILYLHLIALPIKIKLATIEYDLTLMVNNNTNYTNKYSSSLICGYGRSDLNTYNLNFNNINELLFIFELKLSELRREHGKYPIDPDDWKNYGVCF